VRKFEAGIGKIFLRWMMARRLKVNQKMFKKFKVAIGCENIRCNRI